MLVERLFEAFAARDEDALLGLMDPDIARARDGLEMDAPAAWVWRVENNRVAWGCVYGDRDAMPRSLQEGGRGTSSDYLLGPAQHVSRTI